MGVLVARFQTNDKPWSDYVLMQDVDAEWRKRLRPFRGELRLDSPGEVLPGPFRKRDDAITRAVKKITGAHDPGLTVFVSNARQKGVRAHVVDAEHPFGSVFHTSGPCKDDYDNIVVDHNMAGQLVKLQKPAMLAYHEAEQLNGKPIRITGMGWRSCSEQTALYESSDPPGRFAPPDISRHPRGLALDIYNTPDNLTPKAKASLEVVGFCCGVPGEPWHYAYLECG